MSILFMTGHTYLGLWLGSVVCGVVSSWVCLRLNTVDVTAAADTARPSLQAVVALFLALFAPVVCLLTTLRLEGLFNFWLGGAESQARWLVYVCVVFSVWALVQGNTTRGNPLRLNERHAWATALGVVWIYGGIIEGLWGIFLILELALILLLLLIAYTEFARVLSVRYGTQRVASAQVQAERSLIWVFLLLLWTSAFALLLLVWAWVFCVANVSAFELGFTHLRAQAWGQPIGLSFFKQSVLGLAVLFKLLIVPAEFVLVRLYLRLTPASLLVYLNLYYFMFLPFSTSTLLTILPGLLPYWAVQVGVFFSLGVFLLFSYVRPLFDVRVVIALSTLFTLLLLLAAVGNI